MRKTNLLWMRNTEIWYQFGLLLTAIWKFCRKRMLIENSFINDDCLFASLDFYSCIKSIDCYHFLWRPAWNNKKFVYYLSRSSIRLVFIQIKLTIHGFQSFKTSMTIMILYGLCKLTMDFSWNPIFNWFKLVLGQMLNGWSKRIQTFVWIWQLMWQSRKEACSPKQLKQHICPKKHQKLTNLHAFQAMAKYYFKWKMWAIQTNWQSLAHKCVT